MRLLRRYILAILLLLPLAVCSQTALTMRFDNIQLPYGANIVDQVFQDHYGMIWLVTRQGVYTFDGYTARNILKGNFHSVVAIDNETLCFGCDHGVRWLNARTKQQKDNYPQLPVDGDVRSLAYKQGHVYVGTRSHGLFCLDMQSKVWQRYTLSDSRNDIVFNLCPYKNGIFVCHLNGLAYMDGKGNLHDCGIRDNTYSVQYDGKRQCLWMGTEHNLLRRDLKTGNTTVALSGSTFNRTLMTTDGRMLLATEYGLQIFNPDNKSVEIVSHDASAPGLGLPSNRINYIFRDRQNNLWLGTDHGVGLSQLSHRFEYFRLTDITHTNEGNVFTEALIDSEGGQWLGGDNGILHIFNGKTEWFRAGHGLKKSKIRCIYEDRDQDVWIATDASIARYNRLNHSFDYYDIYDNRGRNANWAYGIYEDEKGRFWIATYMGGLYVVDKKALLASGGSYVEKVNLFAKHDDDVNIIYRFIPDGNGLLWAYTSKGLATINTHNYKVSLKHKMFMDAMTVADGSVWIDVQGKLYRYDMRSDKMVDMNFEVRNGMIYTLVPERNRVWMPTTDGLYYIDTRDNTIHPYSKPDYGFTAGVYNPSSNSILWGGEDVLGKQYINVGGGDDAAHKVYITGVTCNADEILCDGDDNEITLTGRENVVISLATFDYSQRNSEVFWYRIGENGEWQSLPAGTNHITIPYLQGGSYKLYLSTNPSQSENTVSAWTLDVPYPWYLRWWAWMGYIVIIFAGLVSVAVYYKRHEKSVLKERERENTLALTQQKMEFFVDMSHELKTPLSLIIAPLDKLLTETTNAKLRARLKSIQANALKLNGIIHRILDFKRMETESDDQILASHVELVSLLRNVIDEFGEQAKTRGIDLNLKTSVEQLWMDVDVVKIQMVVRNLLSNAMKYVSDGVGNITLSVEAKPQSVLISVSDNGPGVADNDLQKIFNRYFKGDDKHHGTGIGLSVVKKYVQLHGGSVEARNNNGLTVSFTLPVADTAAKPEHEENTVSLSNKPKVLIVDDNHEMVDFLMTSLEDNYACITAYSGEEALEKVKEQVPDIIITDQMMPGMDGTELCRRLRHEHATANTPIIMLTAKDDSDTEMKSIGSGADVFMPKPFNLRKLQLHIVQLLKRHNSIVQNAHIETINQKQPATTTTLTGDEALMAKIVKAIDDNISSEDFNVGRLSEIVGVEQKQLYRKIKALTGETPVTYLRNYRLKRAATLLKQDGLTVSEVMYQVGFSSASYFTKCFTKVYGVSPKEYQAKK